MSGNRHKWERRSVEVPWSYAPGSIRVCVRCGMTRQSIPDEGGGGWRVQYGVPSGGELRYVYSTTTPPCFPAFRCSGSTIETSSVAPALAHGEAWELLAHIEQALVVLDSLAGRNRLRIRLTAEALRTLTAAAPSQLCTERSSRWLPTQEAELFGIPVFRLADSAGVPVKVQVVREGVPLDNGVEHQPPTLPPVDQVRQEAMGFVLAIVDMAMQAPPDGMPAAEALESFARVVERAGRDFFGPAVWDAFVASMSGRRATGSGVH